MWLKSDPIKSAMPARRLTAWFTVLLALTRTTGYHADQLYQPWLNLTSTSTQDVIHAFKEKLEERHRLAGFNSGSGTSGVLLVATGANKKAGSAPYALECSLAAAMLRAHNSLGLDGLPVHITLLTDSAGEAVIKSHGIDRLGLFDTLVPTLSTTGYAAKLHGFLATPYNYTMFVDCDVVAMLHSASSDVLALVSSADTDIAWTETWAQAGQSGLGIHSHGRAGFCGCIVAWANLGLVRQVWTAALRLFDVIPPSEPFFPGAGRRGDQEALYAVVHGYRVSEHGFDLGPALAVRTLPLEWQCPTEVPQQGESLRVGKMHRTCHFTHWHPHVMEVVLDAAAAVLEPLRGGAVLGSLRSAVGAFAASIQEDTKKGSHLVGCTSDALTRYSHASMAFKKQMLLEGTTHRGGIVVDLPHLQRCGASDMVRQAIPQFNHSLTTVAVHHGLVFLNVPKCASSSSKQYFTGSLGGEDSVAWHAAVESAGADCKCPITVSFTRDPMARFVSGALEVLRRVDANRSYEPGIWHRGVLNTSYVPGAQRAKWNFIPPALFQQLLNLRRGSKFATMLPGDWEQHALELILQTSERVGLWNVHMAPQVAFYGTVDRDGNLSQPQPVIAFPLESEAPGAVQRRWAQAAGLRCVDATAVPPMAISQVHLNRNSRSTALELNLVMKQRICRLYHADYTCLGISLPAECEPNLQHRQLRRQKGHTVRFDDKWNVEVLTENSVYRFGDIVSHHGFRWARDSIRIMNNEAKYGDSMLYKMLQGTKGTLSQECRDENWGRCVPNATNIIWMSRDENINLLADLIAEAHARGACGSDAEPDALVVHLRMGDATEAMLDMHPSATIIAAAHLNGLQKVELNTVFHFAPWLPADHDIMPSKLLVKKGVEVDSSSHPYSHSNTAVARSLSALGGIYQELTNGLGSEPTIISVRDPDAALCHMVASAHFMPTSGGFSQLISLLRERTRARADTIPNDAKAYAAG